jgi:replicative DNA helicase
MSFEKLNEEVNKGLSGNNNGIPMGFDRLNRYIGIRKSMFFLIGGNTGSGKTSFIDDCFVLNPFDWYISNQNKTDIKLKIWYRSMERSSTYKYAKWICRRIFLDHGISISVNKLLGWTEKMNKDEYNLFLSYQSYMDKMKDVITVIEGPENPVGIAKELKAYALKNGKIIQKDPDDEYSKVYVPNDPNEITIVIIDHIGLLKTTKDQPTKKDAIDKMSNELQYARDFFGFTPVVVSQFNRSISNPMRLKAGDVEPQLEDFSDSSSTQNDADVVLALFDPLRYKVEDTSGYDLNKLKDEFGGKYFRSLRLLKNSYGEDDIRIGLGFLGQLGIFKELPRKRDITDADYESIINKSYFLQ